MIHALAARVEPNHGGAMWLKGVRAFVVRARSARCDKPACDACVLACSCAQGSFFTCDDCSQHFMTRTAAADISVLTKGRGGSGRAASLWAWRVHNEVNARLALEEGSSKADPAHPKQPWPSAQACPGCACASQAGCKHTLPGAPGGQLWDEDAVWLYLDRFYGPTEQEARSAELWDPFGLGRAATEHGRARLGHAAPKRTGRALDQHEPDGVLSLHAAPGGVSPGAFIAMCALTPVGLYALCATASERIRRSSNGKGRGGKASLPRFLKLVRVRAAMWRGVRVLTPPPPRAVGGPRQDSAWRVACGAERAEPEDRLTSTVRAYARLGLSQSLHRSCVSAAHTPA